MSVKYNKGIRNKPWNNITNLLSYAYIAKAADTVV